MDKFRIFALGKRSIKVTADDSDFLADLVGLLSPFHVKRGKEAALSLRAVIPAEDRESMGGADRHALETGDLSGAVSLIRDLFDSR